MSLSVHMMLLNASGVVSRALRSLRGAADEVCYVDTGSTDGTPEVVERLCREEGFECRGVCVDSNTRPDFYFQDVAKIYLPCEVPDCTNTPLLRDWAAARNLGLELCRGQYVIKLDADDEVMDPENVSAALERLDDMPKTDVVCCPYEVMDGKDENPSVERVEMYARIWRNRPEIRFREVCHENVDWIRRPDGSNWVMVAQGLTVRDWRDSRGSGVRIPHRNFKVLLREYLALKDRGSSPGRHLLIYLADEAASVMPQLALEVLGELLDPLHSHDLAWTCLIRARCFEKMGMVESARREYRKVDAHGWPRGGLLAALMMARIEPDVWRDVLVREVSDNIGTYYPQGASCSELREAGEVLQRSRGRSRVTDVLVFDPTASVMFPEARGRCRSGSDGECDFPGCPQIRDGEPEKTGRACPLLAEHGGADLE